VLANPVVVALGGALALCIERRAHQPLVAKPIEMPAAIRHAGCLDRDLQRQRLTRKREHGKKPLPLEWEGADVRR